MFSFCKFLGHLDEKRATATNFDEILSEHVLRIKTKSHKVGHHKIRGC